MLSMYPLMLAALLVTALALGYWLGTKAAQGSLEAAKCVMAAATDARRVLEVAGRLDSVLESASTLSSTATGLKDDVDRMAHNQEVLVNSLVRMGLVDQRKVVGQGAAPATAERSSARETGGLI